MYNRNFMRCRLVAGLLLIVPVFLFTYLPWRIYRALYASIYPGDNPVATLRSEMRAFGRFFADWPRAFRSGTQLRIHPPVVLTAQGSQSGRYQGWGPSNLTEIEKGR